MFYLQVFFGLITGADNMARLPPFLEIFSCARGSAKCVFEVIARQSKIDSMDDRGNILDSAKTIGNIEFKDIFFNYPSRPDVRVFFF